MQTATLVEFLRYMLQQANDWLKFSESKNIALLAFDSGLLVALIGSVDKIMLLSPCLRLNLLFLFLSTLISFVIVFWSMRPKTKKFYVFHKLYDKNHNLQFYGDLAHYSPDEYLKGLKDKYLLEDVVHHNQARDLAQQVITNASIALSKFSLFNNALLCTLIGIGTSSFCSIIWLIIHFKK